MVKTRKSITTKTITISVLVAASTGIIREAYVPYPEMQKNPQYTEQVWKRFIKQTYLGNMEKAYRKLLQIADVHTDTYGYIGPKCAMKSEERKQELLDSIRSIRAEIRIKAEIYHLGKNTVVAETATKKTEMRCALLMERIVMLKA